VKEEGKGKKNRRRNEYRRREREVKEHSKRNE